MKVLALALVLAAMLPQSGGFEAAQFNSGGFGAIPHGTRVAGVVGVELTVDETGRVTNIVTLKALEPFSTMITEAVSAWRFEPATFDGEPIESRVLVAGLFRPPMLLFPNPGPPSGLDAQPSDEIPFPTGLEVPNYPPRSAGDATVIVEVAIDQNGNIAEAKALTEASVFTDSALQAARGWSFRPGLYRNRGVATRAYLIFAFRHVQT